ncbi:MAG: aldolase [Rhodospirillaceae bacterium]|nr:aldolase [Rhodospirillaceae bacterium]
MITFKSRIASSEHLIGTFVRTPSPIVCDVLSRTNLDFVCIDSEHAPLGPHEIDACLLAFRGTAKSVLVRIPAFEPRLILNALDSGATGILVPHVTTAQHARDIVAASHYGPGGRGYAGSTRAAHYGAKPMAEHLKDSAANTTVIVQIEDLDALDALDEIAAVDGLDGLFVGRMDLTVALGAPNPQDPRVLTAVQRICDAGRKHNKAVGMFTPTVDETAQWKKAGASFFILSSDHGFLTAGANTLKAAFDKAF